MHEKFKVGISIGDINGVGLEVILKTLNHPSIKEICIPIIYGSSKVVSYHKNIVALEEFQFHPLQPGERVNPKRVNVMNCWQENVNISLGVPTEESGKYAYLSLDATAEALKNGEVDLMVTAPINKQAMKMANFPYPGHTEYLTQKFGGNESLMLLVNEGLRIGLVTNHLPLSEAAAGISKERVIEKLKLFDQTLKRDFGLERPTIAVLGLNPHAGDGGVIGNEEERLIRPAVVESKKSGMFVMGPFPADGFFGSGQYAKFDGILAMYHDQGLIPFKTLSFGRGVNYTAGLNFIRTSPDHGTAYDITGKNSADPASFRQALFLALDLARNRQQYDEMHSNKMARHAQMPDEENNNNPQ